MTIDVRVSVSQRSTQWRCMGSVTSMMFVLQRSTWWCVCHRGDVMCVVCHSVNWCWCVSHSVTWCVFVVAGVNLSRSSQIQVSLDVRCLCCTNCSRWRNWKKKESCPRDQLLVFMCCSAHPDGKYGQCDIRVFVLHVLEMLMTCMGSVTLRLFVLLSTWWCAQVQHVWHFRVFVLQCQPDDSVWTREWLICVSLCCSVKSLAVST